jgi:hypothetical protein
MEQGRPPPAPPPPLQPPLLRDRHLDAAVDRLLVTAADVFDEDAAPPSNFPSPVPADADVPAVATALAAIARPAAHLPWHGRQDIEPLIRARIEAWAAAARSLAHRSAPAGFLSLEELVWATGDTVAAAAAVVRGTYSDFRSGLTWALHEVRRTLPEPDAAWDEDLATVRVERRPRFRLATGFDAGSGTLLWARNDAARDRWDYPVDHFDLPVPLPLAHRIQGLIDRYDLDHPDVGTEHAPFTPQEYDDFRAGYLRTLDELRRVLGPAYEIEDRGGPGERPESRPAPRAPVPSQPEWTRNRLHARVPPGWTVKESVTLLSPDGQANVIVSREPVPPALTTEAYARAQGDLLRRQFPGYRELADTVLPLAGGAARLRRFSWVPPDGTEVTQQQVYVVHAGTGFTATATSPTVDAQRFAAAFDQVLRSLRFDP